MPGPQSAIPVGTQFSPELIDLPAFLQALVAYGGDKPALEAAVWVPGVRKQQPRSAATTPRTRSLPLEAARQYGLLDQDYRITPLAERLAALQPPDVYDEFAKHILLHCGGLRVVEGVRQMEQDHLRITGDSLAQYLTDQGFRVTVHNTAINTLRMWLAEAGVFNKGGALWQVNKARQEQLLGLTDDTIAALVGLNEEQRAFVEALCRINPAGRYPAADVRALAATIIGRSFGQGSLPNAVLEPLKRAGLIDYETRGTRGGKSARLWTLPAFDLEVLDPFIRETVRTLDPALTAYFTKRPADIYADLDSADTFIKGHGLEAFAIYIMRLLGLRFVDWRKRGNDTGGAEIDVVMTGLIGVQPAVWQIQCKNTPSGVLRLEEVAKEVGLLPQTKATNILILANCRIAPDAYRFAQKTMRDGPTNIYLIDKAGYERIRQNPVELAVILREQAEQIRQLRHDVLTSTLSS